MERPEHESAQPSKRLTFEDVEFEKALCPTCGADQPSDPVLVGRDTVWDLPGEFPLVQCTACEQVYTSPRPTAETMGFYYDHHYSDRDEAAGRDFETKSFFMVSMNERRLKILNRVRPLTSQDALIDVGCSYGLFLKLAYEKHGVQAYGVDLDPGCVTNCVDTENLKTECIDLRERAFEDGSFDVVTLFETLEHVYDPRGILTEVHRILKPGGYVCIEVPRWDSWTRVWFGTSWFPLLLPQHLQHYAAKPLKQCVESCGFQVEYHKCLFAPAEMVLSMWVVLKKIFGAVPKGQESFGRKIINVICGLFLVFFFIFVEFPLMILLYLLDKNGHQTLIAKRVDTD